MVRTNKIFSDKTQVDTRDLKAPLVFTNGCFDLLHEGHISCLRSSRAMAATLIVGLNSDRSVRELKGAERPVQGWQERAEALINTGMVDLVIKFDELTPLSLIKYLRPDIITKGGDYQSDRMIGREFVESYGGRVEIMPFLKGFSTTSMLKREKDRR